MGFTAEWLALRARADRAARDVGLLAALGAALGRRKAPQIVDIGCGTGAMSAALDPWTPKTARRRLVDSDEALLARAAAALPDAQPRLIDLARSAGLNQAMEGADAVVASAFFDLVSDAWLAAFVAALPPQAVVYAALTYDGVERWAPEHPDDAEIRAALHRHMARDKGLGVALGPAAAGRLAARLQADGRRVLTAPSPWRLTAERDGALMSALADGIASAVGEIGVDAAAWRAAPRSSAIVGHIDLFAGPRATLEPATPAH